MTRQEPAVAASAPFIAPLIAICGVDGAGKSSLVELLEARRPFPRFGCLRKKVTRNRTLIQRFHARDTGDYRDLNDGPYAAALAIADAFDFLDHFDTVVRPALGSKEYDFLVLDRYTPCYAAYLACVAPEVDARRFFAGLPSASLSVLVTVDHRLLAERYVRRGGASEDENSELVVRFDAAYEGVIGAYSERVVRIVNNDDIEVAYANLVAAMSEVLTSAETEHRAG
jgi:thymidylate kinase